MATDVQTILEQAVASSFRNRADTIATMATELVRKVDYRQKELFAVAAEVNPLFFGTQVPQAGVAGSWSRPADAEIVFRIEYGPNPAQEIAVVPYDDRAAEPDWSVYQLANSYIRTSVNHIADTDTLNFWYARRPMTLTGLGSFLDGVWPESYNDLLILPIAAYLARKDGRLEEAQGYIDDTATLEGLFVRFLKRQQAGEIRRFNWPRIAAPTTPVAGSGAGRPEG